MSHNRQLHLLILVEVVLLSSCPAQPIRANGDMDTGHADAAELLSQAGEFDGATAMPGNGRPQRNRAI